MIGYCFELNYLTEKRYNMGIKSIQEILKTVEQPSRYTGKECNAVIKKHEETDLRIALVFPDLYEIGTSHFGIQILYNILNNIKGVAAERAYTPAIDMEKELRENGIRMFSRETKTPLEKFDILGFSLLYELNYTNILTVLDCAGIPFLSSERTDDHPVLIAGGPCTFNPEPVADIFDAMVVGDGEKVIIELVNSFRKWKEKKLSRYELLKSWSTIQGVYIPSFFKQETIEKDGCSIQVSVPLFNNYTEINKTTVSELESEDFPVAPVVPLGRPVHERLRLEISRGCSRGCRFCQAGMIYRPVRERSVENLVDLADKAICNTGYEDLSLLSLSTGDYENLGSLMLKLLELSEKNEETHKNISFSLPSVRAGRINAELMEIIKKIRKTGFTIAPEAGSQRLRNVLNKGITEEDIIQSVTSAFDLGWNVIKLYFMIGLPTETEEDVKAITELVLKLRNIKNKIKRKGKIHVSLTTFIPKPHCPFQWEMQLPQDKAWERILQVRDSLKYHDVNVKWGKTQISFLEGLMARGDRRLTPAIISAYNKGCRLDGWNEHFRIDLWEQALEENNINPDDYLYRERPLEEPLPWDHIKSGVSRSFFEEELKKSRSGYLTEDCRYGVCSGCGVCDFENIMPRIIEKKDFLSEKKEKKEKQNLNFKKIRCVYSKRGDARYLGHMELVNLISRCLRRSGIPVKYSSGFHKIIKIVCGNPLPVGYESMEEFFIIEVNEDFDTNKISSILNALFPEDLRILRIERVEKKSEIQEKPNKRFSIVLDEFDFSKEKIDIFNSSNEVFYEKINKKGESRLIDLKKHVKNIVVKSSGIIELDIHSSNGIHIRPDEALRHIFSISRADMEKADILKLMHFD